VLSASLNAAHSVATFGHVRGGKYFDFDHCSSPTERISIAAAIMVRHIFSLFKAINHS
jgi:hypothetical protein